MQVKWIRWDPNKRRKSGRVQAISRVPTPFCQGENNWGERIIYSKRMEESGEFDAR